MTAPFVFVAMGSVVSLHTAQPLARAVEDDVLGAFVELEDRFSLWRPDSEGARFARREVPLSELSTAFRTVYDRAVAWRALTGGAFTPHRPDGAVDLSGIVKALAIHDAGAALAGRGVHDWCLNAGGDVLVDGVAPDGRPWRVGIVDPEDRAQLLSMAVTGEGRHAVATSGTSERGEHVWRIGADDTFVQVSVSAADIVTADVLATAILAGGPGALRRAEKIASIDVLACTRSGELWASQGFRAPVDTSPHP